MSARRPRTNVVLPREALVHAARERASAATGTWKRHRNVMRFLQRYYSAEWEAVEGCRTEYRAFRDEADPKRFKLVPFACHRRPYCIPCVQADESGRLARAIEAFRRCTPVGKEPSFLHIVATSPITDDPRSWGAIVSRDVAKFRHVVGRALRDVYGEGIGALMSYQDFGEKGFAKTHPHLDLTLNGWVVQGDQHHAARRVDLKLGNPLARATGKYAQVLKLGAGESNVSIGQRRSSVAAYAGILRYQIREMVDLRKLVWNGGGQVGWKSYKDARTTWMTVDQFQAGLFEYGARLHQFLTSGNQKLTVGYGHMSDSRIGATQDALGRDDPAHRHGCACRDCGEWRYDPETPVEATPDPSIWEDAS